MEPPVTKCERRDSPAERGDGETFGVVFGRRISFRHRSISTGRDNGVTRTFGDSISSPEHQQGVANGGGRKPLTERARTKKPAADRCHRVPA
jgi:hypothetical protein